MWRFEDDLGEQVKPLADPGTFAAQADAESWIGETWRDLLDEGVHQVFLLEGDRVVYGPMGLNATT